MLWNLLRSWGGAGFVLTIAFSHLAAPIHPGHWREYAHPELSFLLGAVAYPSPCFLLQSQKALGLCLSLSCYIRNCFYHAANAVKVLDHQGSHLPLPAEAEAGSSQINTNDLLGECQTPGIRASGWDRTSASRPRQNAPPLRSLIHPRLGMGEGLKFRPNSCFWNPGFFRDAWGLLPVL